MSTTRIIELRAQLAAATDAVSLDQPESVRTTSGVERGRALYDRRSPEPESDGLGRSRRTRRSTERGIAWAQDIEQSKVLSAKIRRTKERKARRTSMSASAGSQAASQAAATQDGEEPAGDSQYETLAFIPREKLLEKLSEKINLDCTGLTTQEILDLLDAPGLSDDQTAPMETEDNDTEVVMLSSARVSIGGGFHLNNCPSNDHGGTSNSNRLPTPTPAPSIQPFNPPAENSDTESESDDDAPPHSSASPSKRAPSASNSQPAPKRSRIESPDNTDTEPEIEEVPTPYQVPRSRASTGTVIPDSQTCSPNPSTTASPLLSAPKPPRTYAVSRSFVGTDSNHESPNTLPNSQRGTAVSAISLPSLGAPLLSPDRPTSRNPDTLSRMSSISLGGSIPAQPYKPTLRASESQSQPVRLPAAQSQREPQAPSQAPPSASHDTAPRSGAGTLRRSVPGGEQPASGVVGLNPEIHKPVSGGIGDKLADTRERLHKLISVIIGPKEPEHDSSGATSSQHSGGASTSTAATASAQPSARGEIMPDDEEERRISAARAKGKRVRRRKNKPLTSDFEGRARQVIIMAKLLLFTYVVVFGPYLTRETYLAWAPLIYELAWYREYPELPYELPPKGVYEVMVDNLSSLKGSVKLALRNVVTQIFKKLRRPALTPGDVKENLAVLRDIYPNHFHCINPTARQGHYQGEIMEKAISAAFFHGPHAIGILFHDLFDPIPIPTVCFILANLQFCVEEWSTGHFKPTDLNLGNMPEKYLCHIHNLNNFRRFSDEELWVKRRAWFKHAVAFSGASHTDKIESSKYIIDISEFQPASPQPQPQPEPVPELESEDVPEHEPGLEAGPSTA